MPSRATDGDSSGPAPAVSWTGGPPVSGSRQMLVAPPRFEACTIAAPSLVNARPLREDRFRFLDREPRRTAGSASSSHISAGDCRPCPARSRWSARRATTPDGEETDSRLSAGRTVRGFDPSAAAIASSLPCRRRVGRTKTSCLPSGDQLASAAPGIVTRAGPPSAGTMRTDGTPCRIEDRERNQLAVGRETRRPARAPDRR